MHRGLSLFHRPLLQVVKYSPIISYPCLQINLAVCPCLKSFPKRTPFLGIPGSLHVAVQQKERMSSCLFGYCYRYQHVYNRRNLERAKAPVKVIARTHGNPAHLWRRTHDQKRTRSGICVEKNILCLSSLLFLSISPKHIGLYPFHVPSGWHDSRDCPSRE